MFDQVSIIGCGLIGSSIFKGLKKVGLIKKIITYDKDKEVSEIIKKDKLSDEIFNVIDEIGIATNRTNVNFFLLNFNYVNQSAAKVFNKLANSGILVRQMDVYGIKNSLRVTIGNSKENKKFISVLRKIFNV